jgi:hypothetical protein
MAVTRSDLGALSYGDPIAVVMASGAVYEAAFCGVDRRRGGDRLFVMYCQVGGAGDRGTTPKHQHRRSWPLGTIQRVERERARAQQ